MRGGVCEHREKHVLPGLPETGVRQEEERLVEGHTPERGQTDGGGDAKDRGEREKEAVQELLLPRRLGRVVQLLVHTGDGEKEAEPAGGRERGGTVRGVSR